jgi:hypothetical protein
MDQVPFKTVLPKYEEVRFRRRSYAVGLTGIGSPLCLWVCMTFGGIDFAWLFILALVMGFVSPIMAAIFIRSRLEALARSNIRLVGPPPPQPVAAYFIIIIGAVIGFGTFVLPIAYFLLVCLICSHC